MVFLEMVRIYKLKDESYSKAASSFYLARQLQFSMRLPLSSTLSCALPMNWVAAPPARPQHPVIFIITSGILI